ncbi:MAG: hypothetical protein JO013_10440 [Alphaproteobacteria bacterium]|nr:hypothetical protein [Alphaproteobacteria bacterium]
MIDLLLSAAAAAAAPLLAGPLAPMAPLVGHCWAADLPGGRRDVHCFEAMYGGRFVRDRHEVGGGGAHYLGETIYGVEHGEIAFTYWSSDGETVRGTMRGDGRRLDFGETAVRNAAGRETGLRTVWLLADDAYDVRWNSDDPRLNRTMHYVRVGASALAR